MVGLDEILLVLSLALREAKFRGFPSDCVDVRIIAIEVVHGKALFLLFFDLSTHVASIIFVVFSSDFIGPGSWCLAASAHLSVDLHS